MGRFPLYLALAGVCGMFLPSMVEGVAVMSVDLGSEWMKVAVVTVRKIFVNSRRVLLATC